MAPTALNAQHLEGVQSAHINIEQKHEYRNTLTMKLGGSGAVFRHELKNCNYHGGHSRSAEPLKRARK